MTKADLECQVVILMSPAGVDLLELVEAQPLRLLHARRQRAQEILGRHENLHQSAEANIFFWHNLL